MLQFQNRKIQLPDGEPVVVTRVLGSIDGQTVRQFEEKLLGFQQQGVKHLIVVFSEVNYINSTGMGILVKLADKFQEVGGDISLIDVPEKMIALFTMLGIDSIINISKTEEEALMKFQMSRSAIANVMPRSQQLTKQPSPPAPRPQRPEASQPKPVPPKPGTKPLVIVCRKCKTRISLGNRPKVGTYKCPRCMALFKLFRDGKIQFS